jgi:hypothetical protein
MPNPGKALTGELTPPGINSQEALKISRLLKRQEMMSGETIMLRDSNALKNISQISTNIHNKLNIKALINLFWF